MKNKLHWTSCPTHLCNCIFGFITFLLTCCALLFVVINYSLESLCEFSTKVFIDSSVVLEVQPYFQTKYKGFVSPSCMSNSPVQIVDYIYLNDDAQKDNLKEIDTFLDGFSYYDNFLKITPSDKNINTIKTTVNNWDPYRIGVKDNFDNVQSKILNIIVILRCIN